MVGYNSIFWDTYNITLLGLLGYATKAILAVLKPQKEWLSINKKSANNSILKLCFEG